MKFLKRKQQTSRSGGHEISLALLALLAILTNKLAHGPSRLLGLNPEIWSVESRLKLVGCDLCKTISGIVEHRGEHHQSELFLLGAIPRSIVEREFCGDFYF